MNCRLADAIPAGDGMPILGKIDPTGNHGSRLP